MIRLIRLSASAAVINGSEGASRLTRFEMTCSTKSSAVTSSSFRDSKKESTMSRSCVVMTSATVFCPALLSVLRFAFWRFSCLSAKPLSTYPAILSSAELCTSVRFSWGEVNRSVTWAIRSAPFSSPTPKEAFSSEVNSFLANAALIWLGATVSSRASVVVAGSCTSGAISTLFCLEFGASARLPTAIFAIA